MKNRMMKPIMADTRELPSSLRKSIFSLRVSDLKANCPAATAVQSNIKAANDLSICFFFDFTLDESAAISVEVRECKIFDVKGEHLTVSSNQRVFHYRSRMT